MPWAIKPGATPDIVLEAINLLNTCLIRATFDEAAHWLGRCMAHFPRRDAKEVGVVLSDLSGAIVAEGISLMSVFTVCDDVWRWATASNPWFPPSGEILAQMRDAHKNYKWQLDRLLNPIMALEPPAAPDSAPPDDETMLGDPIVLARMLRIAREQNIEFPDQLQTFYLSTGIFPKWYKEIERRNESEQLKNALAQGDIAHVSEGAPPTDNLSVKPHAHARPLDAFGIPYALGEIATGKIEVMENMPLGLPVPSDIPGFFTDNPQNSTLFEIADPDPELPD